MSNNIPSSSGTTYTFAAWGKSQGAGGTNNPAVRVAEYDKNHIWLRQTDLHFPKGTADWNKLQKTFTTGTGTAYIGVYANIWNGYGTFWVDDISLTTTTPTSTPAPTTAPTAIPTSTPTPTPTPTPAPTPGTKYFVATNGNDNNPGTDALPWRTITKAANTATSGSTVYVKNGIYHEKISPKNNGVSFISQNVRGAIIDGTGFGTCSDWLSLVTVNGKTDVSFTGFEVRNSADFAFQINGGSNILLSNNYIHDIGYSAIYFKSTTGVTINGNEITKTQSCNQGQEIVSLLTVDGFEISNNSIHDNYHFESINAKEGSSNGKIHNNNIKPVESAGIYMDAWNQDEHDIQIYNNVIHDGPSNVRGIAIASEQGGAQSRHRIYNNIIYNNGAQGIVIDAYDGSTCYGGNPCVSGPIDDIQIIGNTVYNNDFSMGWGGGIHTTKATKATNIVIRNNIAWNNNVNQISPKSTDVVDHNLVNDPRFVNANGGNFHLQSTSPAIDKGSSTGEPSFDFDGNPRPKGAGYDIGAFEY